MLRYKLIGFIYLFIYSESSDMHLKCTLTETIPEDSDVEFFWMTLNHVFQIPGLPTTSN